MVGGIDINSMFSVLTLNCLQSGNFLKYFLITAFFSLLISQRISRPAVRVTPVGGEERPVSP